jgi:DNA polymerase-3 subunit delta'
MNEVCANKILKILEEPSGKTLFLLVTEDSEKLLSTIISRTQRVLVPRIDEESMRRAVSERFCVQEPQLSDVVRIANGDLIMAESIISSTDEDKEFFELFCMVMRAAYARKLFEIKAWAETMAKGMNRKRQVSFLAYAQRMIRENFIMNVQKEDLNYMTSYENSFSVRFSPFVNEHNIWGLLSELELAERHIEQNVQAKLVFFDLALKLIMLLKK